MSEWQPIETAPKDGTEILGLDARFKAVYWIVKWDGKCFDDAENFAPQISHWMPLPEPPK